MLGQRSRYRVVVEGYLHDSIDIDVIFASVRT